MRCRAEVGNLEGWEVMNRGGREDRKLRMGCVGKGNLIGEWVNLERRWGSLPTGEGMGNGPREPTHLSYVSAVGLCL